MGCCILVHVLGISCSTRGRVGAPESFRGLYQGILRGLYQAYQGVNWGLVRAWSGCFVVDFVRSLIRASSGGSITKTPYSMTGRLCGAPAAHSCRGR